jgi:hypothetical protein
MPVLRGELVVRVLTAPYTGTDAKQQSYTLRSLVAYGSVFVGEYVDQVPELELVYFQQGAGDKLWKGLQTITPGTRVAVHFSADWVRMRDRRDHERLVLKPNRLLSLTVLERPSVVSPELIVDAEFVDLAS